MANFTEDWCHDRLSFGDCPMLVVRLVEKSDGTIVAETRKQVIGQFKNSTRTDVVQYLINKAREVGEDITFVDEFREQSEERVNWEKLIKRHY